MKTISVSYSSVSTCWNNNYFKFIINDLNAFKILGNINDKKKKKRVNHVETFFYPVFSVDELRTIWMMNQLREVSILKILFIIFIFGFKPL